MTKAWMKDLPVYTRKSVTRPVGGDDLTFHPLSGDALFALRGVGKSLSKGIMHMMSGELGTNRDQARRDRYINNTVTGEQINFTEVDAVPLDLVQERFSQRERVAEQILHSLTSDETQAVLGMIILDSLRPRDDEGAVELADGSRFLKGMEAQLILDYLAGVKEANEETFGPFLEWAKGAMGKAKGLMTRTPTSEESPGGPESPESSGESSAESSQKMAPEPEASV